MNLCNLKLPVSLFKYKCVNWQVFCRMFYCLFKISVLVLVLCKVQHREQNLGGFYRPYNCKELAQGRAVVGRGARLRFLRQRRESRLDKPVPIAFAAEGQRQRRVSGQTKWWQLSWSLCRCCNWRSWILVRKSWPSEDLEPHRWRCVYLCIECIFSSNIDVCRVLASLYMPWFWMLLADEFAAARLH